MVCFSNNTKIMLMPIFIDLFNTNASIVRDLAKGAAESAPNANILIIANPVRNLF